MKLKTLNTDYEQKLLISKKILELSIKLLNIVGWNSVMQLQL